MLSYLKNNDYIKISFVKPFFKDFYELYFSVNLDIIYYDNSHLNYIYKEEKNNIEYTFYGFFKDNYFVIICDCYCKKLNTLIEYKNIILIKLNWIIKKIDENTSLWMINILDLNKKNTAIILNVRRNFFIDRCINIDDYLKINFYDSIKINIKNVNEIKKNSFFEYIYNRLS